MAIKKTQKEKESIIKLQEQVKELEENWKRALADYHNLEKRIEKQQASFLKLANIGLIDKLLNVLDDLDRAAVHIKDKGLGIVLEQFKEIIASEGVKELSVLNQEFDPKTMECVEMVKGKKNLVLEVQSKGYSINDHIVRPAKVKVGAGD